jgi:hypothetical protein
METVMDQRSQHLGATVAAVGLAVAAAGLANMANAACTDPGWSRQPSDTPGFITAVYHPSSNDGWLTPVSDENAAIVGLWKFEMLAKSTATHTNPMPDGVLIDFGTAAWHSDGTELMNSGARNPADGDFCQGVWAKLSASTFVLNHIALAWTNGTYTGPVRIRERVTVDASGRHFSGAFRVVQYLATVTPGHEFDQNTALVTITGTITGTRITAP